MDEFEYSPVRKLNNFFLFNEINGKHVEGGDNSNMVAQIILRISRGEVGGLEMLGGGWKRYSRLVIVACG